MWMWLKNILGIAPTENELSEIPVPVITPEFTFDLPTIKIDWPKLELRTSTVDISPYVETILTTYDRSDFVEQLNRPAFDFAHRGCFVGTWGDEIIRPDINLSRTRSMHIPGDDFVMIVPPSKVSTHENLQRCLNP